MADQQIPKEFLYIRPVADIPSKATPDATDEFLLYDGTDLKKSTWSNVTDYLASGVNGEAKTTDTPPTTGFYRYVVHEAGTYTNFLEGGVPIEVTTADLDGNMVFLEVTDNVAKKVVLSLPAINPVSVLDPLDESDAVTGKAVANYLDDTFEDTFIDKYETPLTYENVSTTLYDEGATKSNYSPITSTDRAHYNILNIATKSGKLVEIKVWAMVAGTMRIVVGTNDYTQAERFDVRAEVGVFDLSVGSNTLTIDFDVLANERVAISGGSATVAWANYTYEVGNKFVAAYTNSDTTAQSGTGGRCILFQTTFQYINEGAIKDRLDKEYYETVEQNVIDSYNRVYPNIQVEKSAGSIGLGNSYSPISNTTRAHYNILNKAEKDGKVIEVVFTARVAGNVGIRTGVHDYLVAGRIVFTSEPIYLDLVEGDNYFTVDIPIKEGELLVVNGGSATLSYNKATSDGNRFVQAYTNTDEILAPTGTLNRPIAMAVTFEYPVISPFREVLEAEFIKKEEIDITSYQKKTVTNIVNVSTAEGNNAVQNALTAITDNSETNRYQINVAQGLYKITSATEFLGNLENDYPAMIVSKDFVDINGESKSSTILWAELPYDDAVLASQTSLDRIRFQTIWSWADSTTIRNITFVAKNLRYTLHQDRGLEANKSRTYENCDFIFLGRKGYRRAFGIGTFSGSKTFIKGGKSQSQDYYAFSIHNNRDFSSSSLWSFENHKFENLSGEYSGNRFMLISSSGSMQDCTIEMINCSSNLFMIDYDNVWLYSVGENDSFNYANWRVTGVGNTKVYFNNLTEGKALMIKSLSTGLNSKVRFNTASTAFADLIPNPYEYYGVLGHPERMIQDKYVIFDGSNGLSGYAIGGKSIIEGNADNGVAYQCSLGIRLGDCSVVNKTLGIIIDGTTYNVVFNKDYTAMSNTAILAEINTVIGSVAIASEYNIGGDYHAEFSDVLFEGVNASTTTPIQKGTLVTMNNNRISPCGENDVLYGLAIDDIGTYRVDDEGLLYGKGRVIKNCYVTIESGKIQTANNSGTGTKYKIENGEFVADVAGKYMLIDGKYLEI